jgi:putative ABC transport system permease protein
MINFLFKGVIRDRSRSLFPILVVAVGVMLTVFLQCWMKGIGDDMIRSSASFVTGHLRVMSRAYAKQADQVPNDLAYSGVGKLLADLRQNYPELIWIARIRFGGLLDVPDTHGETKAQGPTAGLAVDLLSPGSPEPGILNLKHALVRGRLPVKPGEILVSDDFARRLGTEPGAVVTLIGSTMFGSQATRNFTIVGTVRFGAAALDRGALIADIGDVQQALEMDDAAGEVLGLFRDFNYNNDRADKIARDFNVRYAQDRDEFAPVMATLRSQPGLALILDLASANIGLIIAMFVIAMSIVLWNVGLIGSLRRYGEFGMRLAIGEGKGHVYRTLLVEAVLIGLIGSLAGTAIGLLLSFYMQQVGINIGGMMKNATMAMPDVMRARVTPAAFFIGFIPGLGATLVGSAISGTGIFRRQTAKLAKELEA